MVSAVELNTHFDERAKSLLGVSQALSQLAAVAFCDDPASQQALAAMARQMSSALRQDRLLLGMIRLPLMHPNIPEFNFEVSTDFELLERRGEDEQHGWVPRARPD